MDLVASLVVGSIKCLAYIYDWIAYIPSLYIYNSSKELSKRCQIKAVPVAIHDREGKAWAKAGFDELQTYTWEECQTLDKLLERAVYHYPDRPSLGTRELLREEDEKQPNGKVFKKLVKGDYYWITFSQLAVHVDHFARGLLSAGVKPRDRIIIFSETRSEWLIAALACFKYNITVVTLYATLGEEGIIHGINEPESSVIIASNELLPKLKKLAPQLKHLRTIVWTDYVQCKFDITGFPDSIKIVGMTRLEEAGMGYKGELPSGPTPNDVAVIMYTSGSTGVPKGVLISHYNLIAALTGECPGIPNLGLGDTYIAYLPLAHVLELCCELGVMSHGARIGYATALTLTDQSSKVKKGSKGDATILKPTLMAAVPLVMDRMYKTVWEKVDKGGPLSKKLFQFAYDYKKYHLINQAMDTPIFNTLIFNQMKKILGGHVRLLLSGGAPLSPDTQTFMGVCFGCPVIQGYGLTETCGGGTIQLDYDRALGVGGPPLSCSYIMLRNWEEGNYLISDQPNPRGEVLVGGPNVSLGYYKNEAKTKEDYTEFDGQRWFCTGDIGQFQPDGNLKIIDRKKDLVKLQAGEYVSLSKIESVLSMAPLVENLCVFAESNHNFTVCLVVPNKKNLINFSTQFLQFPSSFSTDTVSDDTLMQSLVNNDKLAKEIARILAEVGTKGGLLRYEIPVKVKLCSELWTPDSGLVTAAFKLKRKAIADFYKAEIDKLYQI